MAWFGWVVVALVFVLSFFVGKGLSLKKAAPAPKAKPVAVDPQLAAEHLAGALRCKTYGLVTEDSENIKEFEKLQAHLRACFPHVFQTVTTEEVNRCSRLYCWKGDGSSQKPPILLMAHQDVVPIAEGTEQDWKYPPFDGRIEEGCVWGRGAIDMKNALVAIFEAMEALIKAGFVPDRDVYICNGHDEELMLDKGSKGVAALCKKKGLHFEFVLDEGSSFVDGEQFGLPGQLCACIGVYEKGYCDVRITLHDQAGHSSKPAHPTALSRMAKIIETVENRPFPVRPTRIFYEMYRDAAPYGGLWGRIKAANPSIFGKGFVNEQLKSLQGNASLRTTVAATQIQASDTPNVLPHTVWANFNCRLNPGDTRQELVEFFQEIAGPDCEVALPTSFEASKIARTNSRAYQAISQAVRQVYGEIPVVPSVFFASTDSQYFNDLADDVYKHMPFISNLKYTTTMHATNERIDVESFAQGVQFYAQLLQNVCSQTGQAG